MFFCVFVQNIIWYPLIMITDKVIVIFWIPPCNICLSAYAYIHHHACSYPQSPESYLFSVGWFLVSVHCLCSSSTFYLCPVISSFCIHCLVLCTLHEAKSLTTVAAASVRCRQLTMKSMGWIYGPFTVILEQFHCCDAKSMCCKAPCCNDNMLQPRWKDLKESDSHQCVIVAQ